MDSMLNCIIPVSYTHLDVYKRQFHVSVQRTGNHSGCDRRYYSCLLYTSGGVRAGEDSLDAGIREIKEETGVDVTGAEGGRCV